MKKFLLFLFALTFLGSQEMLYAQTACGDGFIKRWTGTIQPGDMAAGRAGHTGINQFIIDGNNVEWVEHITGPLNSAYTTAPIPTYQPDPYSSPVAPANVQFDGLRNIASPSADYDRDRPGQDHRDLRYFAFTYDPANIYFMFRRPGNNNSQVSFYYFIDINVDGFMKTGEPVIKVTYNGSTASVEMYYYIENSGSNATAAGSWVSGKGNSMSATVARTGNHNTSEWVVGSADGWSMPGSVAAAHSSQLPAMGTVSGVSETFAAAAMTSAGNTGYAAEFAIPWKYLKLYTGTSTPPPAPNIPLTAGKIFTWHTSLDNGNGNNNSSDDEDNAGGCCSGLAVSGSPGVTTSSLFGPKPGGTAPWEYRVGITYADTKNISTRTLTTRFTVTDPKDANGVAIPGASVQLWSITGYKDEDCNGVADGAGITFTYNGSLSSGTSYVFTPADPSTTGVVEIQGDDACFLVDINTQPGGWPPLKSVTYTYNYSSVFNIPSEPCDEEPGSEQAQGGGSGLPVKITYFNAVRNGRDVKLTWQTATEENNAGFKVERLIGASGWVKIGYVSTQAQNGNSASLLNYEITDFNNTTKGISQYRLRQMDIDGKFAYSAIRSVRGDGQKGKTIVYPNPSNDGKVNVVFEDVNVIRDISLIDMNGRIIKQWNSISNNNIQIDNLVPGFYTVRIVNKETGEQDVEKIIVNKR